MRKSPLATSFTTIALATGFIMLAASPRANVLPAFARNSIGCRYNPFMTCRAGLAWHNEYNWMRVDGMAPDGTALNTVIC